MGKCCEEVDTEWFLSCASRKFHFFNKLWSFHGGGAKGANAACFRNRSYQFVVRDATHTGKHDGVFNVEKFGESSTHVSTVVHSK